MEERDGRGLPLLHLSSLLAVGGCCVSVGGSILFSMRWLLLRTVGWARFRVPTYMVGLGASGSCLLLLLVVPCLLVMVGSVVVIVLTPTT